uniref:Secreted protein n=1 Tax=Trichogramma kaykai TaxID=54128 RepID=A0ABD2VVE5_9HYME
MTHVGMYVCVCVCVCVCSRLRGHTLLASPPELNIFFRTRCLVPSCECGSRFCRRWQVPNLLCRLHLAPSCVLEGPQPPHPTPSCECGSRFRLHQECCAPSIAILVSPRLGLLLVVILSLPARTVIGVFYRFGG